jgi:hypothetical protein
MKLIDLFEAPVIGVDYRGEFEPGTDTTFNDVDKKLFKNPKHEKKIINAFKKTPYDFVINFLELDGLSTESAINLENAYDNRSMPIILRRNNIYAYENIINVVIIHNLDPEPGRISPHMPMTSWIVAHKIGHSIMSAQLLSKFGFYAELRKIDFDNLTSQLLTFKSAKDPYTDISEIYVDMIAQFLIQGKMTFNTDDSVYKLVEQNLNTIYEKIFSYCVGKTLVCA